MTVRGYLRKYAMILCRADGRIRHTRVPGESSSFVRFSGSEHAGVWTDARACVSRCCGLAARGGLRGAQGAGIALFTLLSRRIDAMEGRLNGRIHALSSRTDSVNSRIDALRQALFSHKNPAA